jgi:hypothetical protein
MFGNLLSINYYGTEKLGILFRIESAHFKPTLNDKNLVLLRAGRGGLAQHLFVVSPTNLQLMPCILNITLPLGNSGESAEPRLGGWLLEAALRGSSLEEKV